MKTDLDRALDHARIYVHHRGVGVKPLTWEEMRVVVSQNRATDYEVGYDVGYSEGRETGLVEGYEEGFADGQDIATVERAAAS